MTFAFIVDSVPFTKAVIAGETSLGGSESACLGLARSLRARGHGVHIFTTQLAADAQGPDHAGVMWHGYDEFMPMNQFIEWDVVVSLRMFAAFAGHPVHARLRLLWNQDLLVPGQMQLGVMATAWALDHLCYVSDYHRAQWEALQPDLAPIGWVTRNGFDPGDLPVAHPTKDPHRIIHSSRPERGLGPLLEMWPALKARKPDATLRICRYSSMYDQGPGSWTDVCAQWDAKVEAVNQAVGGITYLGELHKRDLYREISEAAVMWYPGVSTFAETNCIAALEAEACGTPFVGSYRGALPETSPTGILIKGDHRSQDYQAASIDAVMSLMDGCASSSFEYRKRQKDGRVHAKTATYTVLAANWEQQIERWFAERYQGHKSAVLRQLLHEDDHVAAKMVADEIVALTSHEWGVRNVVIDEAVNASAFCDYVIAGKDHDAEHYGKAAIADPVAEADASGRFQAVIPSFASATSVLDVACGNGSFAIALARAHPTVRITGLDYAEANILRAREAADRVGVGDRCTFIQATIYDFDQQRLHADWYAFAEAQLVRFDGLFVGEFIEHCGNYGAVIDGLETALSDGASVVYTCPHGAYAELVPRGTPLKRGHVHRFHYDDVGAVWGPKADFRVQYFAGGMSPRGTPIGNWLIQYTARPLRPAGRRPLEARIHRTRPLPTLSVGMIVKDAENDLGRCLASVYQVADEIVIGDTGSTDGTKAIAESYGATVFDLGPIDAQPEGFAGARNAVLARCTGDWFHWIDADEQLMHGYLLRRYLDGQVFNGFVLHQTHLYLDGPPTFDIPVRVFRHTGRVRFYGCIHEQPQDGDPNADIYPTLDVPDLAIAHTGYLTAESRETKRLNRNLPLLLRDAHVFAERVLGKVLQLREAVIQADMLRAQHGGLTSRAQQGYAHAIRIFLDHFDDPAHKYHTLARPWYEAALRHLGIGWEHEIALAGKLGGLQGQHARPERIWVRDGEEFARVMAFKVRAMAQGMAPVVFITNPDGFAAPMETREEAIA
ncbi:MAG: hypothetical protein EWM73_03404 [Nitrospira sp.]|nr:MAG: hypothetical protein EWM73_03404 [Nitrospira sp.]